MGLSDFLSPFRPNSVAFAEPYRLCAPSFRSRRWGASPVASPDLWSAGTLTGNHFGGDDWISQVPGGAPVDVCRAFRPRTGSTRQALRRRSTVAPSSQEDDPVKASLSRLYHTAFALAVYASQAPLRNVHARLASGGWPTFTEQDLDLPGSKMSGFRSVAW
jgi:hypothetical protein